MATGSACTKQLSVYRCLPTEGSTTGVFPQVSVHNSVCLQDKSANRSLSTEGVCLKKTSTYRRCMSASICLQEVSSYRCVSTRVFVYKVSVHKKVCLQEVSAYRCLSTRSLPAGVCPQVYVYKSVCLLVSLYWRCQLPTKGHCLKKVSVCRRCLR